MPQVSVAWLRDLAGPVGGLWVALHCSAGSFALPAAELDELARVLGRMTCLVLGAQPRCDAGPTLLMRLRMRPGASFLLDSAALSYDPQHLQSELGLC